MNEEAVEKNGKECPDTMINFKIERWKEEKRETKYYLEYDSK